MLRPRIIPCLLLKNGSLVKGVNFKDHKYVGNPMNAIRIFSKKGADELMILDIQATLNNQNIDTKFIKRVADECFIPFSVGGGIKNVEIASKLIINGAEKVVIGTAAVENPNLINDLAKKFGSQSVIISVDIKKINNKYFIYTHCGQKQTKLSPIDFVKKCIDLGAGEILINSIDRDGTRKGYDLNIINKISCITPIPITVCGGANSFDDFKKIIHKVEAVAAGSMFVFYGKNNAVLINFPTNKQKEELTIYKWRSDGNSNL